MKQFSLMVAATPMLAYPAMAQEPSRISLKDLRGN